MKRSRAIDIPLVVRVATTAMLLGCGADHRVEAQRCVTRDWEVVPDANCDAQPTAPGRAPIGHSYFWYYGGRGFGIGERASGGSTVPPTGGVVTRPNSGGGRFSAPGGVSTRGGFGSHASGGHVGLGG
jgi:hypothetical protein